MKGVSPPGGFDHSSGAVDCSVVASLEALTHERRGNSMPAADLEDQIIRSDAQLIDNRSQSVIHSAGRPSVSKSCLAFLVSE